MAAAELSSKRAKWNIAQGQFAEKYWEALEVTSLKMAHKWGNKQSLMYNMSIYIILSPFWWRSTGIGHHIATCGMLGASC